MKIQATTPINNINISRTEKAEKSTNIAKNTVNNPIINNSLSEAIGRSQVVSFSGENRIRGSVFEHSCSEFLGDKEDIYYNKDDGSFRHTIIGRDGSLKKQEEFYPQLGKEIITKVTNGIKSVTTKTPSTFKIEKTNEDGEQIYFEETTSSGKKTITTDFAKGRRIIAREFNGNKAIQVIDLKTNLAVTTGDLVLQRVYDEKTDTYNTENIITGQVLKREKFRPNKKYQSIIEYAPGSGNIVREFVYDPKTGGYLDSTFYESGARKSLVKTSKDGRTEDTYTFARDGKTVTSHICLETGKRGNLECETVYIPGTELIDNQTLYEEESCTKYKFRQSPNVPHYAEHYVDGELVEEIKFQRDGESYEYSKQYKKDGSFRENFFDRFGYQTKSKSYTADNFLYQYVEYSSETGEVSRCVDVDRFSGDMKETIYDEGTGYAKRITIESANGRIKEIRDFYPGSTQLRQKREFNPDGSFFYTKYDETGAASRREEYNADGTKKQNYNNYSGYNHGYTGRQDYNSYTYTNRTQQTRTQTRQLSADEVITHVLDVTSSLDKDCSEISSSEWAKMAEIIGVDSVDELINMDKDTYKKLAKKFHPDLQRTEEAKEYGEKVFKIIQNLHNMRLAQG